MAGRTRAALDERLQFGTPPPMAVPAPVPDPPSAVTGMRLPQAAVTAPASLVLRMRDDLRAQIDQGRAFQFTPVFMAAGVLAYFALPREPWFPSLLACATVLAASARLARGRPGLRAGLLAALMMVAGMLAAGVETWRAGTKMTGAEITTSLTGRVVRVEHQASGRVRLTLDVLATERPVLRHAPGRIRATTRAAPADLRPGETVRGTTRLMPPSGPVRPHSYDFSFKSYFDGIGAVGFFLADPVRVAAGPAPGFFTRAAAHVEAWRAGTARRIAERIGGAEGAIAAALITGVRAGIPEEINEALRITGLYHVISISGLHMALVAGTLMVSLRGAFALSPSFSARRPAKKYAAAVALFATAAYLFISGGDIAAQRSFIMLAVMLLAVLVDRAALTMRNLAISAIVIILMAPHEVAGPSFQMSFAATAALVAAYAAWGEHRERRIAARPPVRRSPAAAALRAFVKYAGVLAATSVVAGLATALFTAWHFQQVSPLGLAANLAAMPFVSVVVMPMAVLASILMPFGLDGPPLQLMGWGIGAMNAIALWLAERSAFDATGAIPLAPVLLLSAALALLTMAEGTLRWAAAPLILLGAVLVADRQLPDMLVSEDARLVAMRLSDGRVAVNRVRPRAFTMQNWQRAVDAGEVVKPIKGGAPAGDAFACDDGLCVARHAGGRVVAHAGTRAAALRACAVADVIVVADATVRDLCGTRKVVVLTARDLARRGSAELSLGGPAVEAQFAIAEPFRPWHEHRRFSRSARGLAPYEGRMKKAATPR